MSGKTYVGKVKSFTVEQGYGFISCPTTEQEFGQDVYLHLKAIEFSGLDPSWIKIGDRVSFQVYVSAKGNPQANTIKVLGNSGYDEGYRTPGSSKGKGVGAGWANASSGWANAPAAGKTYFSCKGKAGASGWDKGGGGGYDSWKKGGGGFGGNGSSPRRASVQESNVREAIAGVLGKDAAIAVKATREQARDGTPLVSIGLRTLNELLKAAGGDVVQGSDDVPDDLDTLPGYDGNKVVGPWFCGTIKEYKADQAYGLVESEAFKEHFGDKECFIHADHLDPDGTGNLIVKEGEEILFPLVEDEEGNAWAWAPVIPKAKAFKGTIKTWSGYSGFIKCDTLFPVFEEDVYCHGSAAGFGGINTELGSPIVFNLHISKQGKPQASSPRPPGISTEALPGVLHAQSKKRKIEHEALAADDPNKFYYGKVKSFDAAKGFGFVECPETLAAYGRDVFMHWSMIDGQQHAFPVGTEVMFQIAVNDKRPQVVMIEPTA